jgi:hypothetical protein
MTLRDTELIGKKLVKHGFFRSNINHHIYRYRADNINIYLEFKPSASQAWMVDFIHELDYHTKITFFGHSAIFTPDWIIEEHKKLQAIFKFLRL